MSLLHQVNRSNPYLQESGAQAIAGRNPFFIRSIVPTFPQGKKRKGGFIVAIPSSSGQSFQHCNCSLCKAKNKSQSLLHQVNRSNRAQETPETWDDVGRNPFFIRSIVPTPSSIIFAGCFGLSQSLLHQVNRSNRSKYLLRGGLLLWSQSLLHQVNRSNN